MPMRSAISASASPLRVDFTSQPPAADRGLETHLGADAGGRVVGPKPARLAALTGHPAVERERDRVEQRRLPGAGLAVQQEQALQVVEADLLGGGERAEGLDAEPVRAHQQAPSRTASKAALSRSCSASLSGTSRT